MQGIDPLIIVVGLVAAVVGFLLFYFRDQISFLQRAPQKTDTDAEIEMLLDKIRQLARSHEYSKASQLVWQAFSVASEGYLGTARQPAQTVRQYGLSMMQFEGITHETVEPLYAAFEKSRYANSPVTLQEFNAGLTGLHRFLQIANQLSIQMQGGSAEAEAVDVADDDDFE